MYEIFNPSDIVRVGFSIETAQAVLSDFLEVKERGKRERK